MPGANDCVIVKVKEYEPVCERLGHPQTSPGQSNERFPNVERAFLCKGGFECVDYLKVGGVSALVR